MDRREKALETAQDVIAVFPWSSVERFIMAGYRAYLKRRNPKSSSETKKLDAKLKTLEPDELKRLVNKIR